MEQDVKWKWRGIRWLIAYVLFWLIAGGGAGVMARSSHQGQTDSIPFIIFIVFIFLIWCAVKDRGNKTTLQKVGWVIGLWIAQSLLGLVVMLVLAAAGIGDTSLLPRAGNMLTGFVILYFAMRRSTVFVETVV